MGRLDGFLRKGGALTGSPSMRAGNKEADSGDWPLGTAFPSRGQIPRIVAGPEGVLHLGAALLATEWKQSPVDGECVPL